MWITVSSDDGEELARFEIPMKRVKQEDGSVWSMADTMALFRSLTRIADIAFAIASPD